MATTPKPNGKAVETITHEEATRRNIPTAEYRSVMHPRASTLPGAVHPFQKPSSGRIAVKEINHLGDEVMKVFRVQ